MTQFWRAGYMRRSINGNTHPVEGHWVDRDDWDRESSPGSHASESLKGLAELRADRSATSCFVNPNADCPVCGQPVFFYQNQSGSRVYFDELGPPWPKHPCTDNADYARALKSSTVAVVQPSVRLPSKLPLIAAWRDLAGIDTPYIFSTKYGTSQWSAWRQAARFRGSPGALLVLDSVDTILTRRQYFSVSRLPKSLTAQAIVFVYRGWLTYFDNAALKPVEIEVQRLSGASSFIKSLVKRRASLTQRS